MMTTFLLAAACAVCPVEQPYDFRAQLGCVHQPDRRDQSVKPQDADFAFADGVTIAIPADADEVLVTAARDFEEYLLISMEIEGKIKRSRSKVEVDGGVRIFLDPALPDRQYKVAVTKTGVEIRAKDSRRAAQALYHLEDRMNLRRAPYLACGEETRTMRYSPRMTHSGWGLDQFPDNHLRQIAHYGFDAILIFEREPNHNAFGGLVDVNDIIRRAKRYGLDTYLYSYVNVRVHPSDPGADAHYDAAFGSIAAAHSKAKGIVFVGESAQFPSHDERSNGLVHPDKPKPGDNRQYSGWYPCRDYPDWLAAVKKAVWRHAPGMEIVFWTYNWYSVEEGPRLELIDALPKDVSLLVTWDMGLGCPPNRKGLNDRVWDYTLSFVGPSGYFSSEAKRAHERGLRLYSMSNTGGETWDMGMVPYLPCPYRWKMRWDRLSAAHEDWGLSGLMESHHFGWWPSFVSELSKEAFTEGGIPFDRHIRAIAARDYGVAGVDKALAAWRLMSDVIADSIPNPHNLMTTYRIGPAYPFNFYGARIPASGSTWFDRSAGTLNDDMMPYERASWQRDCIANLNYTDDMALCDGTPATFDVAKLRTEIELLDDMIANSRRASDLFGEAADAAATPREARNARRMENFLRYFQCAYTTTRNMKRAVVLVKEKGEAAARDAVFAIAREEYANKKQALDVVRADSRLGWEPSQEYFGSVKQIEWCLRRMEKVYGF